jgi:serine/threonine protein kinase/DNA-binding XRE family transcriptional regulator
MDSPVSFGAWLRRRRRTLDLTQESLARQVGCAVATIKKIEADERRPSRQMAERLAVCLMLPDDERAAFLRAARAELASDRLASPAALPVTPPAPPAVQRSPSRLGSYELREQLGAGGFGVVYRAEQPAVGREVAIKIILPERANHPEFIRRFEAEAQLVARLEHPHIVPLYDYWRDPSGAYLVMRFVRGGSLQAALRRGPWALDQVARLLEQIGGALHFAHRHAVVHRDIKPANILLDEDGNAYLADFGIAKDLDHVNAGQATLAGAVVGSPEYLSPEQLTDESITPRADLYSLGLVLYEVLTGEHPLRGLPPAELLNRQLHTPLPALHVGRPNIPAPLTDIIQCATAKRPEDRYPDALSLIRAYQRAIASSAVASAPSHVLPTEVSVGQSVRSSFGVPPSAAPAEAEEKRDTALASPAPDTPYKGLRAFRESDAADFFGRQLFIHRLLERMAEESPFGRFLAIVGPSGSGKSSLVRAGLVPALRSGALLGSEQWFIVELFPGAYPLEELEAALLRIAVNPPESMLRQFREDERGLARMVKRVLPADDTTELVLVIDQFEELFTLTEDEIVRAHVLRSLRAAVDDPRSRVRVIVTLRADFYDRPLLYDDVGQLLQERTEVVLPLSAVEAEQAIVGPAARVGVALEPGLAAEIVHDVGEQPGALPLLQYALTELFERRADHLLTREAYQASGGVRGALARRAEELYDQLDAAGHEATRQLFLRLVALSDGAEETRRRVRRSELESVVRGPLSVAAADGQLTTDHGRRAMDNVIDLYGRYRLLTFDRDPITREPTVEVAHEALIRAWSRLRAWLDTSRDNLQIQRRLATAAAEWGGSGHDPSFLAAGARLEQFAALAQAGTIALNADERLFLEASLAERDRQAREEQERQTRELAQAQALAEEQRQRAEVAHGAAVAAERAAVAQRTAARRLRMLVGALALFLLAAAALSVYALQQRGQAQASADEAERQRRQAELNFTRSEAQRLAAEADVLSQAGGSAELVALLALRSLRLQYTPQGDAALAAAASVEYASQGRSAAVGWPC